MINKTPQRIAVALEYDGETAPRVTAKGMNDIADKIIILPLNTAYLYRKMMDWLKYCQRWTWVMKFLKTYIKQSLRS